MHRVYRSACLLTAALLACGSAASGSAPAVAGGEPAFEAIAASAGLPSRSIEAVLVDRRGFVWFAGDSGVHRFDGRHVHTFDREPDRPGTLASRINGELAETRDAIWILSFAGLLQRLDATTGTIASFPPVTADGRSPGRGTSMLVDTTDRLWVGTDLGLFRFDPKTSQFEEIAMPGGRLRVTALAWQGEPLRLLVGRIDGSIVALDPSAPERVAPIAMPAAGGAAPVPLVIRPALQDVWVGTNDGLWRLDAAGSRLERGPVPATLVTGRIDAIVAVRDGGLWIAGRNRLGLVHWDPETDRIAVFRHHPDDPYTLASDRVSVLALDERDNLWIGLQDGGAARLRIAQQGAVRHRLSGPGGEQICALRELADGRLAVSRCVGSIAVLDPVSGATEEHSADLDLALGAATPTLTARTLVADGSGGFWLPTANLGLLHWQPATGRAVRHHLVAHDGSPLPEPFMSDALLDGAGRLWVACSLGLAQLDAPGSIGVGDDVGAPLRLLDPATAPGNLISGGVLSLTLAAPEAGGLWLGTTRGLVRWDPSTGRSARYVHREGDPATLSDDLVNTVHVDPAGVLWVGTQAGLDRLIDGEAEPPRFRRFGVATGLPDPTINALTTDGDGTLWVGTLRGVASFDAGRERFRAWTPGDGVPDVPVSWRAVVTAADGSVWFGTAAGLLHLVPRLLATADPAAIVLAGWEVGGESRIHLGGAELPRLETGWREGRARFVLAGFGDRRRLAHRLVGLDREWQPMPPDLTVSYEALSPGRYSFEVRQMSADGAWQPVGLAVPLTVAPPPWRSALAYALYLAAGISGLAIAIVSYRRRMSRERQHLEEVRRLAIVDSLTGLPNRTGFGEELDAATAAGAASLALFFIDLDRFKNINDSLGHRFGDRVLVEAARRLGEALPEGARLARLGGDEFTVMVPGLADGPAIGTIADALVASFARPLEVAGSEVVVTPSIGISLWPRHAADAATLVQYADSAMYFAKAAGRNAWRLFEPEMTARVSRRMALETALRGALERGELHAVFQPQVELPDRHVRGAEVLLRWTSPEFGSVPPIEFVPILEDTGLIEPVGAWLLATVCGQARRWREAGLPPLTFAVNVTLHQLLRGDLRSLVAGLLTGLGLPPSTLELEVTESTIMDNPERMGAVLEELRDLGVGLAIDDFGTGYSSFASLAHLPVDKLKIDKAFVDGVGQSGSADTLCAAMIAMAHNLRLVVVAEGVETPGQHEGLVAMGCDEAQGYFYGRPVPATELETLLRDVGRRVAAAAAIEPS